MNTKMSFRINEDNYKFLNDLKSDTNVSMNKLLNIILADVKEANYKSKKSNIDTALKASNTKEIRIDLTQEEYEYLQLQSKVSGLNSVTKEVKYRLLNTMYDNTYFTNLELRAFTKASTEVTIVGRNLNQLVKLLNTKNNKIKIDETRFIKLYEEINLRVSNLVNELKKIILQSKNRV